MKIQRLIIPGVLLAGALVWTLDALASFLFFSPESFLDLLVFRVPADELADRILIIAVLLSCGIAVSLIVSKAVKKESVSRDRERFMRHEMKNLLAPIKGYAELLRSAASDRLDEVSAGYIERILESSKRGIALLDSLKTLQDIESGTCELNRTPCSLDEIVLGAVGDLAPMAEECGVVIDRSFSDRPLAGSFDADLLPGVFYNLIKNAIEHVGGCADPEEKTVRFALRREGNEAVVSISNRGAPIPPEKIAAFFDKYNTDRVKAGGAGLGTTYARLVTVTHGGSISVESDAERGTTVTVRLPILPENPVT
jgi:two-component system, cell cycle sensor histidine kinase PleC